MSGTGASGGNAAPADARPGGPRLVRVRPARVLTPPGAACRVHARFAPGEGAQAGVLTVAAFDLTREVATVRVDATVPADGGVVEATLALPPDAPRGYRLHARWHPEVGDAAEVRGALLVADHWRDAPRMGFLSDFGPGDARPERVDAMADLHLTVVQFYDWMYRHYRLLPPSGAYRDAMGRELSLETVRERIEAVHAHGMAALAYGAIYGVEPEYADEHPDELLYDPAGAPHALIDLFHATDPRPGPWRERLLDEYESVVRELDFDAVHMDQYGVPKRAFDRRGDPVDLAAAFPGLIDAAAERVRSVRPDAAVTFNAVNDWPSEAVAVSEQAAAYVEVWAPHDRYRHLVDIVQRARSATGGKQVVLAAYLEPFRAGGPEAEAAAALATAVIASAGGHHLLIGEGDGVLRDPYYPNHGRLSPAGRERLRSYYDHTAALHHLLFDPAAVDRSRTFANGENPELAVTGAPCAAEPRAGAVWVSVRELAPGRLVVNLVNLTHVEDDRWNAPKPAEAPTLEGLELRLGRAFRSPAVAWADPDANEPARDLVVAADAEGLRVALPPLGTWATLVVEDDAAVVDR